jgi:hypothetical protein
MPGAIEYPVYLRVVPCFAQLRELCRQTAPKDMEYVEQQIHRSVNCIESIQGFFLLSGGSAVFRSPLSEKILKIELATAKVSRTKMFEITLEDVQIAWIIDARFPATETEAKHVAESLVRAIFHVANHQPHKSLRPEFVRLHKAAVQLLRLHSRLFPKV